MRHAHYSTRCRLLPWTLYLQFIGLITRVRIVPAEMRGGYSLENVRIHAHFAAMRNSPAFKAKPTFSELRLQYGL